LAASGPLSYTPEDPPSRDYYFQYSWILPEIFAPATNKRCHFYFGSRVKDYADELFSFWQTARGGGAARVTCHFGKVNAPEVTAPLAVYSVRDLLGRACFLFMQHGSYQLVGAEEQPLLGSGEVVLYRGVQKSDVFRLLRVDGGSLDREQRHVWRKYVRIQEHMLSDSLLSFNTIHDRAKRCETSHILDGTWISDSIAEANGLDIGGDGFAAELWRTAHQSFALVRWVAENKFGPHFVKCKTPIGNIRITTFFAGEHEVRVIDPDRVEILDRQGCRVKRCGPSE
jgi:hypothetical protein